MEKMQNSSVFTFFHNIGKEKLSLSNLHKIAHTDRQVKPITTTKVLLAFDLRKRLPSLIFENFLGIFYKCVLPVGIWMHCPLTP